MLNPIVEFIELRDSDSELAVVCEFVRDVASTMWPLRWSGFDELSVVFVLRGRYGLPRGPNGHLF